MDEHSGGFELLATVSDPVSAGVVAARLRSEGIEVRLHGESLGPYRLTVGDWALTEVWVPVDRLAEARRVMLEAEVDDALGEVPDLEAAEEDPADRPITPVGVLMLIALVLVAAFVARLVLILL